MRLTRIIFALAVLSAICLGLEARADIIEFDTQSTATQMISEGAVTFALYSPGTQHFTIDTTNDTATVTSLFKGTDFLIGPGQYASYDLYNTATTGTLTKLASGAYDISINVLFELQITDGPLAGLIFETRSVANFTASDVPTLPVPNGTGFSNAGGMGPAIDPVSIYVKGDPSTDPVATSFDRLVTVNAVVPEPSTLILGSMAGMISVACARRRSRISHARQSD